MTNRTDWSEHLDGWANKKHYSKGKIGIVRKMVEIPFLLIFVGSAAALLAAGSSTMVCFGSQFQDYLFNDKISSYGIFQNCIFVAFMAFLANYFTQLICPQAIGGGIPEIKTILSGVIKPILLSQSLIVAKVFGLTFALLAGFYVGKEGPFVQISAALADQLLSLKIFRHLYHHDNKRLEIIACACASGVSSTFGTAFGGMLFSMEFTSVAYMVYNLPKAFLTSLSGMIVYNLFQQVNTVSEFTNSETEIYDEGTLLSWTGSLMEIILFAIIGLVCGLFGVLFVYIVEAISRVRNYLLEIPLKKISVNCRRYFIVCGLAIFLNLFKYFDPEKQDMWSGHLYKNLAGFLYMFFVTALSVTVPLPVGLFSPVFLSGSFLGRLLGDVVLKTYVTRMNIREFSLIGAASFSTGVTRGISTAIIVYELSGGRPYLRTPLSVSILVAYFVGNRFSRNVYDVLSNVSRIPYLQELPKALYTIPANRVMIPINHSDVLSLSSTYREAATILNTICSNQLDLENQKQISASSSSSTPSSPSSLSSSSSPLSSSSSSPTSYGNQTALWKLYCRDRIIPLVTTLDSMILVGAILGDELIEALIQVEALSEGLKEMKCTVDLVRIESYDLRNIEKGGLPIVAGGLISRNLNMLNRNNQGIPLGNNILPQSRKENSRNMKEGRGDRLVYMYTRPGSPNSPPSPRSGSAGTPPPRPGSVKSNFLYDEDPLNEIIRYMLTSDRNEHMSSTASLSQASSTTVAFDPSPYQIIKTMQLNKVMKIL